LALKSEIEGAFWCLLARESKPVSALIDLTKGRNIFSEISGTILMVFFQGGQVNHYLHCLVSK
jgi:hypothetical protein